MSEKSPDDQHSIKQVNLQNIGKPDSTQTKKMNRSDSDSGYVEILQIYRQNLFDIERQMSEYVDERNIPIDLTRNWDTLKRKIEELENTISQNQEPEMFDSDTKPIIQEHPKHTDPDLPKDQKSNNNLPRERFIIIVSVIGVILLILGIIYFINHDNTPFPKAQNGEMLFIIFPFSGNLQDAGFSPDTLFADAFQERAERLSKSGKSVRLERWDEPINSSSEARRIGEEYGATLVVWGEFDDINGVRTKVELFDKIPQPDAQVSGTLLPLSTLGSTNENQVTVGFYSLACLRDGLSATAVYVVPLSLGIIELGNGNYQYAESLFTEALTLLETYELDTACSPDPSVAYYWRGITYSLRQDFQSAQLDFSAALINGADSPEVYSHRAATFLSQGNYISARNDYLVALDKLHFEDKSSKAILLGNLGLTYAMEGEFDEAEDHYKEALEINSTQGKTLAAALDNLHLGNLFLEQDQFDLATKYFDSADVAYREEENLHGQALVLSSSGLLAYETGRYKEAEEDLNTAYDIFYSLNDILGQAQQKRYLGQVASIQGRYDEAFENYDAAKSLCEAAGSVYCAAYVYIGTGIAHNRREDIKAAQNDWGKAVVLLESINSPDALKVENYLRSIEN